MTTRVRYLPANSVAGHNAARARFDLPPSRNESMAELLVSPQVQEPVVAAAADIADAARGIMVAEMKTARAGASALLDSVRSGAAAPVVAGGSPRAAAAVWANGGNASWGGFKDPESSHAAVAEFLPGNQPGSGPRTMPPVRPLGRAGDQWHNPKAVRP